MNLAANWHQTGRLTNRYMRSPHPSNCCVVIHIVTQVQILRAVRNEPLLIKFELATFTLPQKQVQAVKCPAWPAKLTKTQHV